MPASIPALPFEHPDAIPLGQSFSMQETDGWIYYFSNLEPIDFHAADDLHHRNWRIGFLVEQCGVKPVALAEAFCMSVRTVQRHVKRFREEGKAGVYRRARPRSRVVVDARMARRATSLLAEGKSGRSVAETLGISPSTFHENLRAGRIARPAFLSSPGGATGPAERDSRDREATMGRATHDVAGRMAAAAGLLDEAAPVFSEKAEMVENGGVLTALPCLVREGLPGEAARHLRLPKGYYGLVPVLLFLAFLFLARTRNPERLRYQPPGEWGRLLGLDRCPEVKTLRRKIKAISADGGAVDDWQRSLAAAWVRETDAATLAVDGHVKVYSGRKGNLPKKFVPRQKLCLKASSSCWINALGGAPLLCIHRQLDPGLVKSIETEVVPALGELGVLSPEAPDLTVAGCGEPALTLVFDREGWSPALFRRLARRGVAAITWRKGRKGEDWAASDFAECQVPISGPSRTSSAKVPLAEKKVVLLEGFEVREIRRRLPCGRQVAIVSTHPGLSKERIAGAMFSRWSQENFFKYMRDEFNLDALTFHGPGGCRPASDGGQPRRAGTRPAVAPRESPPRNPAKQDRRHPQRAPGPEKPEGSTKTPGAPGNLGSRARKPCRAPRRKARGNPENHRSQGSARRSAPQRPAKSRTHLRRPHPHHRLACRNRHDARHRRSTGQQTERTRNAPEPVHLARRHPARPQRRHPPRPHPGTGQRSLRKTHLTAPARTQQDTHNLSRNHPDTGL